MMKLLGALGVPWLKIWGAVGVVAALISLRAADRRNAAQQREQKLMMKDLQNAKDIDKRVAGSLDPDSVSKTDNHGWRD